MAPNTAASTEYFQVKQPVEAPAPLTTTNPGMVHGGAGQNWYVAPGGPFANPGTAPFYALNNNQPFSLAPPLPPQSFQRAGIPQRPHRQLMDIAARAGLSRRAVEKHLRMRLGKHGEEELLDAVQNCYSMVKDKEGRLPRGYTFPPQEHLPYLPIVDLWDVAEKLNLADAFIHNFNIGIYVYEGARQKGMTQQPYIQEGFMYVSCPDDLSSSSFNHCKGEGEPVLSSSATSTCPSAFASHCMDNNVNPQQQPGVAYQRQADMLPFMEQHQVSMQSSAPQDSCRGKTNFTRKL